MAHIEATRAVVEAGETYDGKIIPTVQAEIDRPVRIRDDATVQGSVYGETIETTDGATVEGSVMASEAIKLGQSHVHSEVGTPGKVVGEGARVDGTITGKRVRLTNCVVRGNVVGTEVILEDCVVLGIVTADRRLTVEGSLCYTVRSHGETIFDETTIVLPQAIADGNVTFRTPVEVLGLGQLEADGGGGGGDGGDGGSGGDGGDGTLPVMTEADGYEQDGTSYLTLAPRILNLEKVTDRLDELERAIMSVVDDASDDRESMSVGDVLNLLDAGSSDDSS